MKLVYATDFDAGNIHNWSGLGIYYGKMLEQAGFDVDYVNNLILPDRIFHKMKQHFMKSVMHKHYSPRFNNDVSKYYAELIDNRTANATHILSPNTIILANLKRDLKKILFADATFDSLLNFYPEFTSFTKTCLFEGRQIDQEAVNNADMLIYTSQWAADSAIHDYNADKNKVFIVPFGANLDFTPDLEQVTVHIESRKITKSINLLFLGVDWVRKGGQYALSVTEKLNELGINATLHIVGIKHLPKNVSSKYIVNHGYISKASQEGQGKLSKIIASSTFLLGPSLADCTPVAFSEANAFGVPCIVSNIGGHPDIISNDINGKVYKHAEFVNNAVNYISDLVENQNAYKELCYSSYNKYVTELNWKSAGKKIYKLVHSL
jgi:glycosyltransferase involved in cell wall biosynthesis